VGRPEAASRGDFIAAASSQSPVVEVPHSGDPVSAMLLEMFDLVTWVDLPCSAPACNAKPKTNKAADRDVMDLIMAISFFRVNGCLADLSGT
jgi:hypothetical protein